MANQLDTVLCTKGSCCPTFQADFDSETVTIIDDDRHVVHMKTAEYELSWQRYWEAKSKYLAQGHAY